jgi:hypothetical protein
MFHSRLRLAVTAATALLVLAGVGSVFLGSWDANRDAIARVAPGEPTSGASTATANRVRGRRDGTVTPRAASRVATQFLRTWLAGPVTSRPEWLAPISTLATPQLARGLRATDPSRVPVAKLAGDLEPLSVGDYMAALEASLSDGTTVVLQVVYDGRGWRVSDVRPGNGT